jgi:RND superfamily putative drug exporter
VLFDAEPAAGQAGSPAVIASIPTLRSAMSGVAASVGAQASGVAGVDATAYDISQGSTNDLVSIAPVVLAALVVLLAVLLRSLVAPLYLVATVALSYLAALGLASFVFLRLPAIAASTSPSRSFSLFLRWRLARTTTSCS